MKKWFKKNSIYFAIIRLLVPDRYKIKHDILKILVEKAFEKEVITSAEDYYKEMSAFKNEFPKFTKKELLLHFTVLKNNNEIFDRYNHDTKEAEYMATKTGLCSYVEEKYLINGQSERLNFFYDVLKNLAALVVLFTFVRTIYIEDQNKKTIVNIQKKIEILENKLRNNKIVKYKRN